MIVVMPTAIFRWILAFLHKFEGRIGREVNEVLKKLLPFGPCCPPPRESNPQLPAQCQDLHRLIQPSGQHEPKSRKFAISPSILPAPLCVRKRLINGG